MEKTKEKTGASKIPASFSLERFNKSGSRDGKTVGGGPRGFGLRQPCRFSTARLAMPKRQRTAAVQDAGAPFDGLGLFGGYGIFKTALMPRAGQSRCRHRGRFHSNPRVEHGKTLTESQAFRRRSNVVAADVRRLTSNLEAGNWFETHHLDTCKTKFAYFAFSTTSISRDSRLGTSSRPS
jgi:hypothetical protein